MAQACTWCYVAAEGACLCAFLLLFLCMCVYPKVLYASADAIGGAYVSVNTEQYMTGSQQIRSTVCQLYVWSDLMSGCGSTSGILQR